MRWLDLDLDLDLDSPSWVMIDDGWFLVWKGQEERIDCMHSRSGSKSITGRNDCYRRKEAEIPHCFNTTIGGRAD